MKSISFGTAFFLSALLLFSLQPMVAKSLLPRFGGGANVWTTCLLFFQASLLIGYTIAFAIGQFRTLKFGLACYGMIAATSVLQVWFSCFLAQRIPELPRLNQESLSVLFLLCSSVSAPAILLSCTSPLLSQLVGQSSGQNAYRWYALSNLGSLIGCLAYPFAIEPTTRLSHQYLGWGAGFIFFLVIILLCFRQSRDRLSQTASQLCREYVTLNRRVSWMLYACCASLVLTSCTSQLSQLVTVFPFLWMVPLACYLLSWIIAFRLDSISKLSIGVPIYFSSSMLVIALIYFQGFIPFAGQAIGFSLAVFGISLVCHAQLYRSRPDVSQLPGYYLWIASGGVVGGIIAALIAPNIFSYFIELPIGVLLGAFLLWLCSFRVCANTFHSSSFTRRIVVPMLALSLLFITIPLLFRDTFAIAENVQWRRRDFYGVVKVVDDTDSNTRYLVHGQIQHGAQKITGEISLDDTLYYGSDSGVCRAWSQLRLALDRPLHVGIVGLGTGALSLRAYEGDIVTFYELSQAVEQAARARFKFIASSSGQIDVVLGDGRVLLEREVNQNLNPLDLLVIDAFSNDAVPSHLLTREAFKLYRSRIQEKGIIAFHTTHRLLNIGDVVVANSNDAHLASKVMHSNIRSPQPSQKRSNGQQRLVEWVLVSQTQDILEFISDDDPSVIELHRVSKRLLPWTDDCINIFQIMK